MHGRSTETLLARWPSVAQRGGVWRRTFLHVAGASALASCIGHPRPPATSRHASHVRAVAFDLFTIFDPRTIDRRVAEKLHGTDAAAFATTWKSRLFEDSWLRAAAGRYVAFDRLVLDALQFTARSLGVTLSPGICDELAIAFTSLDVWPDAVAVLRRLRARGVRLATLANFSPAMITALLAHAGLAGVFEHELSTDAVRTYKPDPRAYALAERAFELPRDQIVFAAFGSWDAAGAAWFGLPAFWVNRLGATGEELGPAVSTGPDLVALDAWISLHLERSRS